MTNRRCKTPLVNREDLMKKQKCYQWISEIRRNASMTPILI